MTSLRKQAGKFGLVGLVNTALDFAVFSLLRLLGLPIILANVLSASVGMAFSFFANRTFVFSARSTAWRRQVVLFLAGTAFSMYVLQSIVIYVLVEIVPAPLDLAAALAGAVGLGSETSELLVRSNTAKLLATAVSMTWNFFFYRFLVFRTAGKELTKAAD